MRQLKLYILVTIFFLIGATLLIYNGKTTTNLKPINIGKFLPKEDLTLDDIIKLNNVDVEFIYFEENPAVLFAINDLTNYKPLILHDLITGVPYKIDGLFSTQKVFNKKDAVKALSSVRTLMNIEQLSFVCTEILAGDNGIDYYLEQLYNNIPVYLGGFRIMVDKKGVPYSLNGIYMSEIKLDTTPKITVAKAKEIVLSELEQDCNISKIKLTIYSDYDDKNNYCLSWLFTINKGEMEIKSIIVDANTGEIIRTLRIF